ncbi:substrate-binding periplasmic protein (plasmid) [Catenovulum sp. SX2]|uniref:substrate-binding periplasmic protein n=1 Tax=Catenovulum sp. SX2 TaxID=3398614 RepID=UPI003F8257FC
MSEPPANFVNLSGEVDGYVTDVVKAMQRKLKDKTQIEVMPEVRVLYTADKYRNVLFFSFSRTEGREHKYHWIKHVLSKQWLVYARRDSMIAINNVEELRAISGIGVVRGDIRSIWLENLGFENLHPVTNHSQNLRRLMADRLPVIATEKLTTHYLAHELGLSMNTLKVVFVLNRSDVYIAMSKGTDTNIVQRWQMAAQEITDTGEMEQIAQAWVKRIKGSEGIEVSLENGVLVF